MSAAVLSVVVGTYNRLDQIRDCLESIARETQRPYIVHVTDAGSTDGTVGYLQSIQSETVRPIFVGKKLGQARAYNDVFAQVETPYVCWISDDNIIVDGGLDRAISVLEKNSRIGMIGLKVRDKEGPFVDAPYIGGLSALSILNVNQGMLPTNVIRRIGGFSEIFRDYGIDPDITAKVLFSGYDIVYSRRVAIHHYRNWSVDPTSPEYHALKAKHERSITLYLAKYAAFLSSSRPFDAKRHAYQVITRFLGHRWNLNATEPFLGLLPRDWHNMFNGRFISLADPIVCAGQDFHLRQRWPSGQQLPGCPPEPVMPADA